MQSGSEGMNGFNAKVHPGWNIVWVASDFTQSITVSFNPGGASPSPYSSDTFTGSAGIVSAPSPTNLAIGGAPAPYTALNFSGKTCTNVGPGANSLGIIMM